MAEADAAKQAHELAEQRALEAGALVDLREDVAEPGVVGLDRGHGRVDDGAEAGLVGAGADRPPAGGGGDPEHARALVLGRVLGVDAGALRPRGQLGVAQLERVRDVLQEQEAEGDVLVLRGVHVAAQLVGGLPQRGLEAEVAAAARLRGGRRVVGGATAQARDVGRELLFLGLRRRHEGRAEREGGGRGGLVGLRGGLVGGVRVGERGVVAQGWAEGDAVGEGGGVAKLREAVAAGEGAEFGDVEVAEELAELGVGEHGELDHELAFGTSARREAEAPGQLGQAWPGEGLEDGVLRDVGHRRGVGVLRHLPGVASGRLAGSGEKASQGPRAASCGLWSSVDRAGIPAHRRG